VQLVEDAQVRVLTFSGLGLPLPFTMQHRTRRTRLFAMGESSLLNTASEHGTNVCFRLTSLLRL
jgi:hypothetical protein